MADTEFPQVLPVTLQQGLKILRGDLVLNEGRVLFVCHKKSGGFMGALAQGIGQQFGAVGGLVSGAVNASIDSAADSAASRARAEARARELEELVAKNPGSFSFEAGKVTLIKRSFWTPGVLQVGKEKWVFRNGIEKAHRAPLKVWADRHQVPNKGLA